ncbi:MAG: TonB family protein [Myxococcales bacterium]|nr:TonB family protein [Myxococcales bacterium]
MSMQPVAAPDKDPLRTVAIVITVVLHAGLFGGMWIARASGGGKPPLSKENFVDAQLVRFGKPRDLSFLPHKQGAQKDKPAEIKVARDLDALPHIDDKKKPEDVDPLKKTHAEVFKHLDDQEGVEASNEGSLSGSRAGTATEAKGDPYILSIVDQVGTAWLLPTTIKPADLLTLSADVCLRIGPDGTIVKYDLERGSGNSQFDSSLEATLSQLKKLPPPPDRFRNKRLCPTFSKNP